MKTPRFLPRGKYRELMDATIRSRHGPADKDYQPLAYSFVSLEGFLDAKLLAEMLRKTETPLTRGADQENDRVVGPARPGPRRADVLRSHPPPGVG